MGELHPVALFIVQIGAVAAALTGIGVFVERTWAPMKKWLQDALTDPLIRKLDEQNARFEQHTEYVGYHLGPNGNTQPIHERLGEVESSLRKLQQQGDPDT